MYRSATGVTALDLLVTLAIVTLLVSFGVPALRSYGQHQRMGAAVTALQSDLQFARSEAIRMRTQALACPGLPVAGCRLEWSWDRGWIVFADLNGDRVLQAGEPLLKEGPALRGLSVTTPVSRRRLRFFPNGTAPGSNASITFCDHRGSLHARQLRVSASGRIRRAATGEIGVSVC